MFQEDLGWYGSDTWTADRKSKLRIECPLDFTEFWVQSSWGMAYAACGIPHIYTYTIVAYILYRTCYHAYYTVHNI